MKIVSKKIGSFVEENPLDFYIIDEFSQGLVPRSSKAFLVKGFTAYNLEDLVNAYSPHSGEIVAIGAGGVLDPAKYLAARFEKSLTVIPTALSTNSFATNRSSFLKENSKVSMITKAPDCVVLDMETLSKAGILNSFGLIETVSTVTAKIDWRIARESKKENDSEMIRERSEKLIRDTMELLKFSNNLPEHLPELLKNLTESGQLTIAFGTGRPVSGAEHIISAYIENLLHCPHGAGLYIGIQIADKLHKIRGVSDGNSGDVSEGLELLSEIKEYVREFLPEKLVRTSLRHLEPREGRYTVLDIVTQEELGEAINSVCDKIYKIK